MGLQALSENSIIPTDKAIVDMIKPKWALTICIYKRNFIYVPFSIENEELFSIKGLLWNHLRGNKQPGMNCLSKKILKYKIDVAFYKKQRAFVSNV